jgi:peptide/nickel transport system substrate-binding protein
MCRRDMRQRLIGTGLFTLSSSSRTSNIKVAEEPDYWKPGRPYLDGID